MGVWHHLAGTYDGSAARLYIDGVEVSETAASGSISTISTGDLIIGGQYNSTSNEDFFHGLIDDVRVYYRALSGVEVLQLYLGATNNKRFLMTLQFQPVATGHTYTPQFSTDLVSGVWSSLTGCLGPVTNGSQVTIIDTNAVESQKFYHIQVSLP